MNCNNEFNVQIGGGLSYQRSQNSIHYLFLHAVSAVINQDLPLPVTTSS